MRIDAHQHFWHYNAADFPWIGDDMYCLQQDFLPADLAPERRAYGIDATVAVQARPRVEETDFLLELAQTDDSIVGVVGWVDLERDDLEDQLSRWNSPRLCGFRHLIQDEAAPDDYLRSDAVQRGVRTLQRLGYRYDVLVTAAHLPATFDFCKACDQHTLILDHLGKPDVRHGDIEVWQRDLSRLAALPHVACKLSGLITEADWKSWQPKALYPYLDAALDAFGENRLMFGSDWPVCQVAGHYAQVFTLIDDWAVDRGLDRETLLGANARRLYGLIERDLIERASSATGISQ